MCVDSEAVVASLSILTISILKRTMSLRNELFAAYQTSIPSCVQSKIHKTRELEKVVVSTSSALISHEYVLSDSTSGIRTF